MEYHCDVSDETSEIKRKDKHFQNLTHSEFDKCIRTKHTIEKPDFFYIDEKFNDYVTNHNKRILFIYG